jgi:hypothetical protein
MKINLSEKIIAWLTLLSGLAVSAVAVYYSVAGLVSIFAAAVIPIIVMGVALEVSKLVATIWLKLNWARAPFLIKTYLISAIAILMLITSMGIFGYLSKAHLDQAVPTGDVADKVALIDEKIKTQKENVDAARKALRQMDEAVDQTMARSADEKGADKAAALRRNQQRERGQLQNDIGKAQKEIAALNQERAPIAKELRKVEAEVGPIKYIAALLYGDSPDQNLLESAVRWVIIIIVLVFDPLAVILLLSSQYSFQWFRERQQEIDEHTESPATPEPVEEPLPEPVEEPTPEPVEEATKSNWPKASTLWPFPKVEETNPRDLDLNEAAKETVPEEKKPLEEWNEMIAEAEKAVDEEEDVKILEDADHEEKTAMAKWKSEHPGSSLKMQRKLFEQGLITYLPWEDNLKAVPDFSDDDAAEEAAKWALEQVQKNEESKKKDNDVDGNSGRTTNQESQGRLVGYQQNAEQSERTIWQRIQDAKK